MRKLHLFSILVALSLATSSLWAKPAVADENGKLPGAFSVACGEYVYFSQGNLQYTKSTDTWSFMDEQYSTIETNSMNVGTDYANQDVVSLFGWATSGYNSKYPYMTSTTESDYGPSISSGVWTSDNWDWGVKNSSDLGAGWRVLTQAEWYYLLGISSTARPNANKLRTLATVNGVHGVIIMPDDWTASGVSLTVSSYYATNIINSTDWDNLEEQGCVFLPAAGMRYSGTNVHNVGSSGHYWSSSARSSTYAYDIYFYDGGMKDDNSMRSLGFPVRLVQDVDPAIEPTLKTKAYVSSDPIGKIDMTYTGNNQALLSSLASGATGGTVKYKLSTSGSWGTATSYYSATNAGDYIVQWFVDHTGNSQCYQSSDIQEIHVTIKRKSAGVAAPGSMPTIEATSFTYNGNPQDLVTATGSLSSGYTLVYSKDGVNWSEDIPQETDAGNYTVYYKFYKGANEEYIPSPNTVNANIAKANLSATLPESTISIPYDGTEKTLLEIDPVANAMIWYKLGDGDWTTTPPTRTDAGDYSVQYKIVPDDEVNYNTIGPNTVTVTILDYPTVYDNADPTATLTSLLNTPSDLKVKRTIYADDEYNTICLPFALDESALAASPLAGFNRLKTFKGAQVTGTAPDLYIDIFVEDATTIEAGIPYLITYPSAHADIVDPVFNGITVTTTTPSAISADGVTFQGMFAQVHIDPYTSSARDEDYLFLGANSQLYWPSSDQTSSSIKMRGFRGYFIIDRNSITPALAPKGTRARIMDAPKTTTAIDNTSAKFGGSEKIIENGILYIIRNGVKYNAQGQIVK